MHIRLGVGFFITAVVTLLLVSLQIYPGHVELSFWNGAVHCKTYGWPFVASEQYPASPDRAYNLAYCLNCSITFILIAATGFVVLRLALAKKKELQFGVAKLLWFTLLAALMVQLCQSESHIYERANQYVFGKQFPSYYHQHWGDVRPAWHTLAAIWIGLFSVIEVVRLMIWKITRVTISILSG